VEGSARLPDPLAADLEEALGVLSVEARAALILHSHVCSDVQEVAETLGIGTEPTALLLERGAAEIADQLRQRGWEGIRACGVGALLTALPAPEPPQELRERILARFMRFFS
jgi:hypothetical protein